MTKEEVIKHLESCDKAESVDGPYAHFIVSISREDLVQYGTEFQLAVFDSASVEGKRKMLNEIADELHENYEYEDFRDRMRAVCLKDTN